MAQEQPTDEMGDVFPRLDGALNDRNLSMESLTPRMHRLLTADEVDPEDLQIRGDDNDGSGPVRESHTDRSGDTGADTEVDR